MGPCINFGQHQEYDEEYVIRVNQYKDDDSSEDAGSSRIPEQVCMGTGGLGGCCNGEGAHPVLAAGAGAAAV